MSDCLFCAIARGDLPATKVWEDDATIAFLDINPLARGHTLVIPREHAAKVEDASEDAVAAVMQTARRITSALCEVTSCPDATLAINNGPAAGQEVPHLHLHVIPRTRGDAAGPVHAMFAHRPHVEAEELQQLAAEVQEALGA